MVTAPRPHHHERRRPPQRALFVLTMLAFLAACGGPDHSGATGAAETFMHTAASDPAQACALLSQRTRSTLESDEQTACAEAIRRVGLPAAGRVDEADVYGQNARVVSDTDVLFLARFPDGWKVMAAGCEPRGEDEPYDCVVSGG